MVVKGLLGGCGIDCMWGGWKVVERHWSLASVERVRASDEKVFGVLVGDRDWARKFLVCAKSLLKHLIGCFVKVGRTV